MWEPPAPGHGPGRMRPWSCSPGQRQGEATLAVSPQCPQGWWGLGGRGRGRSGRKAVVRGQMLTCSWSLSSEVLGHPHGRCPATSCAELCHAVPSCAVPCHTEPRRAMPSRAVPRQAAPRHAEPCRATLCRAGPPPATARGKAAAAGPNNVSNMSVQTLLCERIAVAKELIKRAEALSKSQKRRIEGGAKLCGKLKAELNFLHKVEAGKVAIKESHLQSTNLTHLQAIIQSAENLEDVVSVLHVFAYEDRFGDKQTLVVDVVANGGHTWVKAIGRKAEALHNIWLGRGQYGDKSVIEQAEDFLQASRQQPVEYSNPHIIFAFYNSVSSPMAERLKEMGISVRGDIVAVNSLAEPSTENQHLSASESDEEDLELLQVTRVDRENLVASIAFPTQIRVNVCNRVNLDITTLITYVSALSYGGCYFIFKEKVLTEQAAQERRERVLPQLEEFMQGKELFACESAVRDFQSILETLGGPGEKERAALLVKRINVVPDQPSDRALGLVASSKINSRSLTIFGTGDTLKAITMTANSGFVRAAANQGVKFSVFVHQPRALTESKEAFATPLPKSCPPDN